MTIRLPPNPAEAQARADIMAYNAFIRGEAPPPDLLDRVFANWPDMARYRETAKIERLDYIVRGEHRWCWCVSVNV